METLSAINPWENSSDYDNSSTVSNSSYNSSSPLLNPPSVDFSFLWVIFTLRIIWSILAVVGNGFTIYAITKFSSLQSTTNYLVASLAVADFIQGMLTPFVILHHVLLNSPSFVPICRVEKTFSGISLRANFVNILWLSVDRFFYIAYPLRYPLWQTYKKTLILIAITWGYIVIDSCIIMCFPSPLNPGDVCKVSLVVRREIYNYYLIPQVVICFFITIICYIAIAKIAHKQGVAIAALHQPFETLEASIHRKQSKIAKMMFTVLATYILSYVPQFFLTLLIQNQKTVFMLTLEKITTLIYYSNSFLNPFIYAWKSKEFNTAFKKILGIKNSIAVDFNNHVIPAQR